MEQTGQRDGERLVEGRKLEVIVGGIFRACSMRIRCFEYSRWKLNLPPNIEAAFAASFQPRLVAMLIPS